jgi:2-keto-4-pentenoate hydratase
LQTWLANALSAAKHTLAAGQVVMTGAATAHKALVAGDVLTARFTGVAGEPLLVSVCVKA